MSTLKNVLLNTLFCTAFFCSAGPSDLHAAAHAMPHQETIQPVRSQFNFGVYTGYPYYYYNYYPYNYYYPSRCSAPQEDVSFHKIRHATRKRPFSWYYPYSYEYYYPNSTNYGCDWIYTHRGYVYRCQ